MTARLGAHALISLLWLLHWLPLPLLARLGWGLGRLLWWLAPQRRQVARVNLELCFPRRSEAQRDALLREHFGWVGRSMLERGLLWFASPARLQRLVQVHGDVHAAERSERPVMWLLPHFVGMEFVAPGLLLNQSRAVCDVYQRQSNPVFDARIHAGRVRFGRTQLFDRNQGIRPVMRAIQAGAGFVNASDMDFGAKDSVFVPFFGVPACTLLSPARLARNMGLQVQSLVMTMLPGGRGYSLHFGAAPPGFEDADPVAAASALNRWLEQRILEHPAQYLWLHKRFKTRPPGLPPVY